MKKHAMVTLAAAALATAVSYAHANGAIESAQRTQQAAQFADRFATLQGLSSNSSAFMRPAGAAGATGATTTQTPMAHSAEQKMAHAVERATPDRAAMRMPASQ